MGIRGIIIDRFVIGQKIEVQMTSFGAQIENQDQIMPAFKVKGQIYHRAGSLLPVSGENKLLQL